MISVNWLQLKTDLNKQLKSLECHWWLPRYQCHIFTVAEFTVLLIYIYEPDVAISIMYHLSVMYVFLWFNFQHFQSWKNWSSDVINNEKCSQIKNIAINVLHLYSSNKHFHASLIARVVWLAVTDNKNYFQFSLIWLYYWLVFK